METKGKHAGGRPKADNPKQNDIKVRVDDATLAKLDAYCAKYHTNRATAIRKALLALLSMFDERQ